MASRALLEAIAVTAELTGTELSAPAAKVMADDLAQYPERQVLMALVRCRRELRSRLTIADVVARLDDGRPGPEEAWAAIPKDEHASTVWTDEMRVAFGASAPLIAAGDLVAARMAFLEVYRAELARARSEGRPVRWEISLGWDPRHREAILDEAVRLGRITAEHAARLLPVRSEGGRQMQRGLRSASSLAASQEHHP